MWQDHGILYTLSGLLIIFSRTLCSVNEGTKHDYGHLRRGFTSGKRKGKEVLSLAISLLFALRMFNCLNVQNRVATIVHLKCRALNIPLKNPYFTEHNKSACIFLKCQCPSPIWSMNHAVYCLCCSW